MSFKTTLLFAAVACICMLSCRAQPAKGYILAKSEKLICDSLHINTTLVSNIREFSTGRIEPFHYSLSKTFSKDSVIEDDPILGDGLVFYEANDRSYEVVFALKSRFREKGYSIFLLENNFGFNNQPDRIGVLKTTDKYAVLEQVNTDGINYGITNDSLITIIKNFDKKYSLELIAASGDWCEFIIHAEPKSWMQMANEVYKVCPDVVDQGTDTVEALANELKKTKRLYFWWD